MTPPPPFPNLAEVAHDLLYFADAIHDAIDLKAEIARLRTRNHTEVADLMAQSTIAAFAAWLDPKETTL